MQLIKAWLAYAFKRDRRLKDQFELVDSHNKVGSSDVNNNIFDFQNSAVARH